MRERGSLQVGATRRLSSLTHRHLLSPERATIAARKQARKEHLMLDVFMIALGLGFFLVAVAYAHACERHL
jgi:hypothetical protein